METNNSPKINSLDLLKFIASIAIITLHSFIEHTSFMDLYGASFLSRWAVGFFFLVSGFFMKDSLGGAIKYCISILKVYVIWTILYALIDHVNIWSPSDFIFGLRGGIIMPFWYFPTLLISYVFVWGLNRLLKKPGLVCIITGLMFILALMGSTWQNILGIREFMDNYFFPWHERIMGTHSTREGLFNASLYISLGYYLKQKHSEGKLTLIKLSKVFTALFAFVILYILEISAVVYYKLGELDVLITAPFIGVVLLIIGINIQIDKATSLKLRKMSLYNFLVHCFFLNLFQHKLTNQWLIYICTVVSSVLFSYVYAVIIKPQIATQVGKIIAKTKSKSNF